MKRLRNSKFFIPLVIVLMMSLLSISIGYASLSTTLTVNGSAAFAPVDMVRVTNIELDSYSNATPGTQTHTPHTITTVLDLDTLNGTITYNVSIANLGEVDKVLDSITDEIFSNHDMKYELQGANIGSVIKAHESLNFKITFKYRNNATASSDSHLNAKLLFKFADYVEVHNDYTIYFDANGGQGTMNPMTASYDELVQLSLNTFTKEGYSFKKWNTKADGTGISYLDGRSVKNINGESDHVTLYAQWQLASDTFSYQECIFSGQGNVLQGDCGDGDYDYLRTDIRPFSDDYYQKSFELKFTITNADQSRFGNGNRDTLFNMLYENSDNIKGKYPGILLRIENGKWLLQVGAGDDNRVKKSFNYAELNGKEFRLIRYNDGSRIKVYYLIDGVGPIYVNDITNLYATFDTPLTFGANLDINNVNPDRYAFATLNDMSFQYLDDDLTFEEIINGVYVHETHEFKTVFEYNGPCTFNGSSGNITGSNCTKYANNKLIDTNICIFNEDNYEKDFLISFTVDSYVPGSQPESQTTIFNAFRERTGQGYGILLRRNKDKLELIMRDGNGVGKMINLTATQPLTVALVKKDNKLCYNINNAGFKNGISYEGFTQPFNVPVTFGGATNISDQPFRYINGTISNMVIKTGILDDEIVCTN